MLILLTALAAAQAPAATAPAPRMLKDLPGITVDYYDVEGKDEDAIQKSLKQRAPRGADGKPITSGFSWKANTSVMKETTGIACTIKSAKVTIVGTAKLPRLVGAGTLDPALVKKWNEYVASQERDVAMQLGYFVDHTGQLESAVVGQSCDAAGPALEAALTKLKADQQQFIQQQRKAAKK